YVEPVSDRVDHVVHQANIQLRGGIALEERGADPGSVVDADEDRDGDPKLALRFLSTALHQCAHTVGLGQDVDGVVVNLLAEVGDGELVGVLAKQLDAEVGLELGELAADGGFGHPEQCRRFRKAATFHHIDEYQQGVDVEGQVLFHDGCSKYATG